MISYNDRVFFNSHLVTFGDALRINHSYLAVLLVVLCVVTPFTNQFIPLVMKYVKKDVVIRYE